MNPRTRWFKQIEATQSMTIWAAMSTYGTQITRPKTKSLHSHMIFFFFFAKLTKVCCKYFNAIRIYNVPISSSSWRCGSHNKLIYWLQHLVHSTHPKPIDICTYTIYRNLTPTYGFNPFKPEKETQSNLIFY